MEYQHTPKEMAEKLMEFIRYFSDDVENIEEEKVYVTDLFDKLQKSGDFEIIAHYLDVLFMHNIFD